MALLLLNGALGSSSLTGETLEDMFLPLIPYYIAANAPLELVIVPGLLFLGWRAGRRRVLFLAAAALYFALRVWTYLAYRPARLGFAESDHTATPLTPTERQQAYLDLKLDVPADSSRAGSFRGRSSIVTPAKLVDLRRGDGPKGIGLVSGRAIPQPPD